MKINKLIIINYENIPGTVIFKGGARAATIFYMVAGCKIIYKIKILILRQLLFYIFTYITL